MRFRETWPTAHGTRWRVSWTPEGGCTRHFIAEARRADKHAVLREYWYTYDITP